MEQKQIRNFVIIAHIDHGKSTLADRFLELTNTIEKRKMQSQFLDMMDLERERGVTIKMQPVRMEFEGYILNLIDTPGHVDFGYEVSRSLAAVEGAILLVDAVQGIQAQTLANLDLAKKQNLVIIPVINKIDLPQARVKETKKELAQLLEISEDKIFTISAKDGKNIESLLKAVIDMVPCPAGQSEKPLRALIFDSKYDSYKGVVAYIRVVDGEIKTNQKIFLTVAKSQGEAKELGYFSPALVPQKELFAGEIGYIATGIKEPEKIRVGDTITTPNLKINLLPGYEEPKQVVFASLYPQNPDDYESLKKSLAELKLTDASLSFETESKEGLGRGFRCGFLGMFHTEIITERLQREFDLDLIVSRPMVVYKIINNQDKEFLINSPSDWPESQDIKEIQEPWVNLRVIVPIRYLGVASELLKDIQAKYIDTKYLGSDKTLLIYQAPLREIIIDFYDKVKSATQGYGSIDFEIIEFRKGDLVKIDILLAGQKQEPLSKIVGEHQIFKQGDLMTRKLKKILPAQQFSLPIQAAVNGKIIARQTLGSRGKDVIAGLYGGDYSRKRKQLEKQKKGKKKLAQQGKLKIPSKVFLEMLKE
ncbi:translation elongation factor 4 [Candidatus Parcubacteria bacterium]|nr:translation elongation factor 4 [Candidatus Parcubacteria bacterium]